MIGQMSDSPESLSPLADHRLDTAIPLARPIGLDNPPTSWPQPPAHPILLFCESRSQALADIALFICLFLTIALGGEFIIGLIYREILAPEFSDEESLRSAISRMALFPAIIWRTLTALALVVWLTRRRKLPLPSVGLTLRGFWINLLLGIAAFFAILIGVLVCSFLVQVLFPRFAQEFEKNAKMIMEAVPKVRPAIFFGITLFIGFYEELIFRGFLMPHLRRASGSWFVAVLFTTIVFAVLHLQDQAAAALIAIASLSIIFSVLTIWRRSIVPAIFAHALFDFAMFINLYYAAGDQWK